MIVALALATTTLSGSVRAGMGGHAVEASSRLLPDLPVMPGLWESGFGFTFPITHGARLAETRLLGRAPEPQVLAYYVRVLPATGWRRTGAPWLYRRGRERLVLRVGPHRAGGGVLTEALVVVTPEGAAPTGRATR